MPPLTLGEAQRIAVERSRGLDAKEFGMLASREMAIAAKQLPDPVLSAGVDNVPIDGADRWSLSADSMTMRRIGVMQQLTRADKRTLRSRRFELQAEQIASEKSTVLADVERATALAWLNRHYAEAMAAVIAEQREQAKQELVAAQAAYRGGRGMQAEVVSAHSTLVEIDNRANEVARRIRNANTLLTRWIGEAAALPLAGTPSIDIIPFDPATLEAHLARHPEITTMAKREEIAATEARLAQAEKRADWSVELMYGQRGGGMSDVVSVGVSVPLQWNQKNRQDRETAARLAMVEQAKAEKEETLRAHVAEAQAMLNEWQEMRERRTRYEQELIPLASQRTDAVIAAYRGGKSNLSDVLTARRNEIDVRLQAIALENDIAQLWAELAFLFPSRDAASGLVTVINKDMK